METFLLYGIPTNYNSGFHCSYYHQQTMKVLQLLSKIVCSILNTYKLLESNCSISSLLIFLYVCMYICHKYEYKLSDLITLIKLANALNYVRICVHS